MEKARDIFDTINWIPNFFGGAEADFDAWWNEVNSLFKEGPPEMVLNVIMRTKIKGQAAVLLGGEENLTSMMGKEILALLKSYYESNEQRINRISITYGLKQGELPAVEYARKKLRLLEKHDAKMSEQDKIGFIMWGWLTNNYWLDVSLTVVLI